MRLGVLAGVGYGPDLFGRLLALRGWVMGDSVGGVNGDLPLPNGTRTDIFDERDDRPAAYGLISLGDAKERAALKIGYLDNMGNEAEPGVWHTRIGTVGATLRPHPSVEVILQYLDGRGPRAQSRERQRPARVLRAHVVSPPGTSLQRPL